MPSKLIRSSRAPRTNGNGPIDHNSSADAINAKYGATALPEGYTVASSFGNSWDPYTMPQLIGHVSGNGVTLIETPDPNSKVKGATRWSQKVTVITEDGEMLDVWESASLRDWFKRVTPNAEVAVIFQGVRPSKPGKAPMKLFMGLFKGGELPDVREDALPDDFDGSYNPYAAVPTPAAKKAVRPAKR